MNISELEAAIEALGRPRADFSHLQAVWASLEAARRWDQENPQAASRYRELCAELERQTRAAEEREAEAKRAQRLLDRMRARLDRSGVGERSFEAANEPQETKALGIVRQWLAGGESWLVLCGPKGTGKTVAATWAVVEAIRRGDDAAFRRTSEVAKLSHFDVGAAEYERLARTHLLVLDEVGAELLTDYARSQLHELLDRRHESPRLKTLLTSNLLPKAFGERLGERIVDRIQHAGGIQLITGQSMRGAA